MTTVLHALVLLLLVCCSSTGAAQRAPGDYVDSRGKRVHFPLGERSFADEVVSFKIGNRPPGKEWTDPRLSLGPPNYVDSVRDRKSPTHLTLGCAGSVILRFADNVLVDVEGPDLYIFEVGPSVESTALAVSKDGTSWHEVGKIAGGTAFADISHIAKAGDRFYYIRLTDLKSDCGGGTPGADIDAVGAIGAALQIYLNTAVLFASDTSTLESAGFDALREVASQIRRYPGAHVSVEGHTDNVGSIEYNQKLSQARAMAVRDALINREGVPADSIESQGYGEARPIAANTGEEGRQKNRRVEIIVTPTRN